MHTYPTELAPGLWALGNYYYNLYLVRGGTASALVEAGISAVADEVLVQLDALGATPDHLVVTHPHADHVTGLDALRERFPRARVVAGAGAAAFLEHPRAAAALVAEDRRLSEALARLGHPPGRAPVDRPPSLAGCVEVAEGDELDLGGVTLRFLAVGGHSPANLAVHLPELGALLASDSVGFHYPGRGFLPLFFTGAREFLATLDRLEALEPRVLGLGHQGPLTGAAVGRAFAEARRSALALIDRVRRGRADPDRLADELFRECYVDELATYSEANIRACAGLLVRRSLEDAG
ncbi:MAG: MBL fold metallo-hydrolase [Deferrisomatales bacterium]